MTNDKDARGALTGSPKTDSHEFIVTTNREHEEWFRAMFVPECEIDLKSLWAWQEQERRKRAALAKLPAEAVLRRDQEAAYNSIDRFLRNNLCDEDYAQYSAELDSLLAAPRQPGEMGAGVQQTACDHHWIDNKAYPLSDTAPEVCSKCWTGKGRVASIIEPALTVDCPNCGHPFDVLPASAPGPDDIAASAQQDEPKKKDFLNGWREAIEQLPVSRGEPQAAQQDERESDNGSLEQLLVVLGVAGVQVNGGTHGAPWTVKASQQVQADAGAVDFKALVNRFLTWPVPASVYPDGIPGQPGRIGTNLLSALEAEEMLRYVLQGHASPAAESDKREAALEEALREVDSMRYQRDAWRHDAQRMDWIEAYGHELTWVDGEPVKLLIKADDGSEYTGDNWREAIDAAMSREQSGGERG